MTKMKTLDEYVTIAAETYGNASHAVTWITAQISNKGTLGMSHESMLKMLKRMDAKTAVKTRAAKLPTPVKADNSAMKGLFAGLKKK